MTKARAIAWLYGSLTGAATLTLVAAVVVAVGRVDFSVGGANDLIVACRTWLTGAGGIASLAVLVLSATVIAIGTRTAASVVRQLHATRRFADRLTVVGRLEGRPDVRLVEDADPMAFCFGLARPRIHLTTGAVELLSEPEREAVLAHEAHHVRCRDPLRLLLMRSLADGLFVLPALRRLSMRYASLIELAADEAAERSTPQGAKALSSALLALGTRPDAAVVGISPERVDRLLGGGSRWELPLLLIGGAALTLLIVWLATMRLAMLAPASLPLPELLAQACMLAMVVVPLTLVVDLRRHR